MSFIGRLLGRLVLALVGYVSATLAAGLTLAFAIAGVSALAAFTEGSGPIVSSLVFVGGVFAAFISALAAGPSLLAILVAEIFGLRMVLYYLAAGALSAALGYVAFTDFGTGEGVTPGTGDELLAFVSAGLVGGFVYWVIAGSSAGLFQRREP